MSATATVTGSVTSVVPAVSASRRTGFGTQGQDTRSGPKACRALRIAAKRCQCPVGSAPEEPSPSVMTVSIVATASAAVATRRPGLRKVSRDGSRPVTAAEEHGVAEPPQAVDDRPVQIAEHVEPDRVRWRRQRRLCLRHDLRRLRLHEPVDSVGVETGELTGKRQPRVGHGEGPRIRNRRSAEGRQQLLHGSQMVHLVVGNCIQLPRKFP